MKRNLLKIIFIFSFLFTSCYAREKTGFKTRDRMNLETASKIIQFISEKNADGLRKLFSEEVISNDRYLEKDIQKLFSFCDGKISSYEKIAIGQESNIDGGKNSTEYNTKYRFIINETSYLLYYKYTPKNSYEIQKEGLSSIKIIKETDEDKYFCYWNELKPGIFVPE
jgi:hypothetical protein